MEVDQTKIQAIMEWPGSHSPHARFSRLSWLLVNSLKTSVWSLPHIEIWDGPGSGVRAILQQQGHPVVFFIAESWQNDIINLRL